MIDIESEFRSLKDEKYAEFSKKLLPGSKYEMIGIRLPQLRSIAKKIAKDDWRSYLNDWKLRYFEDLMLRGFVISYVNVDLEDRFRLFKDFIPLIDSWSICDSFSATWKPKKKDMARYWNFILPYLDTGDEFQMRYAVVSMMDHFIDDDHISEIMDFMDSYHHDGYYFKMAAAWNLATCMAKYPEKVMSYLKGNNHLDDFTYNKTIQKAIESFRISDEMKCELRKMKRSSD